MALFLFGGQNFSVQSFTPQAAIDFFFSITLIEFVTGGQINVVLFSKSLSFPVLRQELDNLKL